MSKLSLGGILYIYKGNSAKKVFDLKKDFDPKNVIDPKKVFDPKKFWIQNSFSPEIFS